MVTWRTSLAWWIPIEVAERAMIVNGPAAVVGRDVYVGPGRALLALLWINAGRRTVWC